MASTPSPSLSLNPKLKLLRRRQLSVTGDRGTISTVGWTFTRPLAPRLLASKLRRVSSFRAVKAAYSCSDDTSYREDDVSNSDSTTTRPEIDLRQSEVPSSEDGYLGLFVRMLGMDNDPLDREQAVNTLWNYSQGGKHCIDSIMQFSGCINLIVSLVKSNSCSEAAAGLLRNISSLNIYRQSVTESGAIEEIAGLLCQPSLTPEVKEQSICTLWNLSIDEEFRLKIANSDVLPLLVKFLDDEEIKVKEAAGGVLENLALSNCNHMVLVEAGVIPKLAGFLKENVEGHRIIRKESKNALLELSKNDYYKILIIDEGLMFVPIVGAAAYRSFRHVSHSWPSMPDGTEIQRTSGPSRYGASELLLGLNIREKNNLEATKMDAIVGRSRQQFLARIGAIEMDEGGTCQTESSADERQTLLPLVDGVARLVLILELENVSAISRAARAIGDASISEHMRIYFKEAGAVPRLVKLLGHDSASVRESVIYALEKLTVSHVVCHMLEAEHIFLYLVSNIKSGGASESLKEKTVNILARVFNPNKVIRAQSGDKVINGQGKSFMASYNCHDVDTVAESPDLSIVPQVVLGNNLIDSEFVSCLLQIMRISSPNLQRKVASILEYLATSDEHLAVITGLDVGSALVAVLEQRYLDEAEDDYYQQLHATEIEEAGTAIAAASRLLTKLLNREEFQCQIDMPRLKSVMRKILRTKAPLQGKDWVAACLVKIELMTGSDKDVQYPIDVEVTLHETIPRLIEQMKMSSSQESREAAVLMLYTIVSDGEVEFSKAIAAAGGIFPLVEIIDKATGAALESGLSILYNLSMDSENRAAIISAGAVPVLKRVVLSEGPQWARALHLLRTLPS